MPEKHTHPIKKNSLPAGKAGNGKNGLPNGKASKKMHKIFQFQIPINFKNVVIGLFILFFVLSLFGNLGNQSSLSETKPISTVISDVKNGEVKKIDVEETRLTVTLALPLGTYAIYASATWWTYAVGTASEHYLTAMAIRQEG